MLLYRVLQESFMYYRMCSDLQTQQICWVKVQNGKQIIAPAYVFASENTRQFANDVRPVTFT